MAQFFYILTHLQEVIIPLFNWFGNWSYLLLFLVTFMETGLIVFPWLPGESLIFVAASLAALSPTIKISILVPGFFTAALLGDLTNYTIGTKLIRLPGLQKRVGGPRLAQTEAFFKRYGLLAVIFGRFVPVIRNFVPMIAGSAKFPLRKFMIGNLIGVTLWVALAAGLGYFFGSIPLVKEHFSLVVIGIVLLSTLPAGIIYSLRAIRRHIIKKRQF
ncbi:VTT domain-containing protein [Limosilactobacillus ingluviei]|uniref:VTT domain-containing protein n=1 Tax=Limosilactobacillus ingluviei TaxID=148604 RepID=UPI00265FF248|nr:VTT domain-containing protein [Limosilactobacillus ingluviei]